MIIPEDELAEKLKQSRETGKPLRVKYGIDPTGIAVHLGHTVPLRKMRQFQQLGHQAVIIIGNYTALVGDPSGRDQTRARLTAGQVEVNAADYLEQIGKVLNLAKAEVVRNGDWFSRMSFADILELTSKVTVAPIVDPRRLQQSLSTAAVHLSARMPVPGHAGLGFGSGAG